MKYHSLKIVPLLVTAFIVFDEVAISFNSALLPNIKAHYIISEQQVQLSLAFGLFALGLAGLIYGGLADVYGRRPMLIISLTIFSIMTLASALAPTANIFLLTRFLQGLGAGAGWVVGNCCLNDIYKGKSYARIMNIVHAIAGITPAIAPIVGSYLGIVIGWRNCFIILFVLTAILAVFMIIFQAETLENKHKKNISAKKFFKDYFTLFHNKHFVKYTIVKVLTVMMIFVEYANIPLLFINDYGVPALYYGLYIFPVFTCYMFAAIASNKLLKYTSTTKIIKSGLLLLFISNLIILVLYYLLDYPFTALSIQSIKLIAFAGWGMLFGNTTAEIVSSAPGKAGMASAVMIAFEMLFSALGIYFLGFFYNGTIIPLTWFLLVFSVFASLPLIRTKSD